jgi:hypothetical protein
MRRKPYGATYTMESNAAFPDLNDDQFMRFYAALKPYLYLLKNRKESESSK